MSQNEAARGQILTEAHSATMKARHEVYGDPFADMNCAAEFMELFRKHAGSKYHKAHDEAMARVMIKLARIACGAPRHRDSYVDLAAYIAIAFECQQQADLLAKAPMFVSRSIDPHFFSDIPASVTYVEDPAGYAVNAHAKAVNAKYKETLKRSIKEIDPLLGHTKVWGPVSKTNVKTGSLVKLKDGDLYTVDDIKYENCFGEKISVRSGADIKQWVARQAIESVFVPVEV